MQSMPGRGALEKLVKSAVSLGAGVGILFGTYGYGTTKVNDIGLNGPMGIYVSPGIPVRQETMPVSEQLSAEKISYYVDQINLERIHLSQGIPVKQETMPVSEQLSAERIAEYIDKINQ